MLLLVALLCVIFPLCSALQCTQCYSLTPRVFTNMGTVFQSILPSLHDSQCGIAYHSMMTSTPTPQLPFNQQPVLPTDCTLSAVAGTNTEIRCGFYKGYIEVMTPDGSGTASLNVFSMTCYNVDINVDWGCTAREFPLPGDNLHFDNILRSKFSNTVVLTRFVGSVCYCRRTDCTDVINGSSKITPPVLWSVLLGLILVLIRRFQY